MDDHKSSTKKTVLEAHGFTIGKLIGSGTYAKVKVAYSEEFKSSVAVKIISKTKAPKEYLTKFLPREIDVVRGLRHENLIRFYQSIETTHRVYLIMQYAENGSLLDLIRKHRHLTEDAAKKYFRQLISAIDYCHNQGVVHRDIKCENLLLDKNYDLKIIDFGFARKNMRPVNNKPIMSETYCGSYAYASPEVLKGVPYDPRYSDAWATGVVLFAMVYGRLPFDGSNYGQLLKQVQSKVVFPKEPQISSLCKYLIQKILAPLKSRLSIKLIKEETWYKEPIRRATVTPAPASSKATEQLKSHSDKASSRASETPPENHPEKKLSLIHIPHTPEIENMKMIPTERKHSATQLESLSIKIADNIPQEKHTHELHEHEKAEHVIASALNKPDAVNIVPRNSITKREGKLEIIPPPIIVAQPILVEAAQIVSETNGVIDSDELRRMTEKPADETTLPEEGTIRAQ